METRRGTARPVNVSQLNHRPRNCTAGYGLVSLLVWSLGIAQAFEVQGQTCYSLVGVLDIPPLPLLSSFLGCLRVNPPTDTFLGALAETTPSSLPPSPPPPAPHAQPPPPQKMLKWESR